MDFDYTTVKYLVIILSLLILGYVSFLIYTDLTTVRSEFNKLKTKIFETSDSLTELQKQIEYVDANADTEIDEQEHTLHDILNNNLFGSSQDDELEEMDQEYEEVIEPEVSPEGNVSSFSFNIPFFTKESKITELSPETTNSAEIPETHGSPEEIQFVSSSNNKCEGILASGKNKGNQCNKDAVTDSKFCSKHLKNSL